MQNFATHIAVLTSLVAWYIDVEEGIWNSRGHAYAWNIFTHQINDFVIMVTNYNYEMRNAARSSDLWLIPNVGMFVQ